MILFDLRTPRPGRVDPETCPVCALLRMGVTEAVKTGDPKAAAATVRAMHVHMVWGHPNDPRNVRRA
ncbi:hypothetical protein Save01_05311 [Streptomyces avermitilis]|uniref:Uncharacterized protein n=1 Tax=Streptomyces avermitilis TaxID=33903 RepID=A0A4D4MQN9_STRAX|nr:hypothetical protein SAVMC3_63400 [Streptomyces avermitilis]GDY65714.1 hypothetical protein SAV14893_051070 [Streptomyces avermitilis]GDY74066.1 hypothetical protein SAV31267_035510 [Streptomyces avermitilis]GDY83135.1 hypothetical protein SAVCW2_23340 [Streptomyces avermitilis]